MSSIGRKVFIKKKEYDSLLTKMADDKKSESIENWKGDLKLLRQGQRKHKDLFNKKRRRKLCSRKEEVKYISELIKQAEGVFEKWQKKLTK